MRISYMSLQTSKLLYVPQPRLKISHMPSISVQISNLLISLQQLKT